MSDEEVPAEEVAEEEEEVAEMNVLDALKEVRFWQRYHFFAHMMCSSTYYFAMLNNLHLLPPSI